MPTEYNVLAPGPVNLHPRVRETLALPMIHHRTPEFDKILARVLLRLKKVFKTEQPVFIQSATGSGGMEALLVNTMKPGDKVLAIDSGKFGERWAEMAKAFGGQVAVHKVPWGQAVKVADVEKHLAQHPDTRLVLCQACETSTGIMHPIQKLGGLIRGKPDTLLLIDGITALGAYPIHMDEWGIDGLVGGSQKAFMLPTGLALFSFSAKAWKVIESNPQPRYYFDVRRERKANQSGETFFSSNVTLIRALDVVLDLFDEAGIEALFAEIDRRARFTRHYAGLLGLTPFAENPSSSLSALSVPAGLDGQKVRARLEEKHGITIMGGQDQAKGKIIRIGHMGYITWPQMAQLFAKLGDVLNELSPEQFPKAKVDSVCADALQNLKKWQEG